MVHLHDNNCVLLGGFTIVFTLYNFIRFTVYPVTLEKMSNKGNFSFNKEEEKLVSPDGNLGSPLIYKHDMKTFIHSPGEILKKTM